MTTKLRKYIAQGIVVCGTIGLSVSNSLAKEFTVERGELENLIKVEAVAIPTNVQPIKISPQVWNVYKIESFVEHGAIIKKGEALIDIDKEAIDEKIAETSLALEKEKLMLEQAELKLEDFKSTTAELLAEAKLNYLRFEEDYKRYIEVIRPVKISDVEYGVIRATQNLAYSQEELDQLLKMYEEDGLTEETEEIILQRVKNSIVRAQRDLDKSKREEAFEKEVKILRSDADWKIKSAKEKRKWELAQKNLPIELKAKELELAKMKSDVSNSEKALDKLKADRELMNIVSPVDGVVYYGEFKDGKWNSENASKILKVGGNLPLDKTLISVVPDGTELIFSACFSEKQKALFVDEQLGWLNLESQPWESHLVQAKLASEVALLDQKWLVFFTPEEPISGAVVSSKAKVVLVSSRKDNVLSIPKEAVTMNSNGIFNVKLKMADSEPEIREIKIGMETGDRLEILEGLKEGQVIIVPESKSK